MRTGDICHGTPGVVRATDLTLAIGLTVLCTITRVIAIPASLWEWDDVLFARALHRFDITVHAPQPPGFPVLVMLGRAAYAVLGDEHRAYAAVSCVFGSLLAGGLFYLYREVFQDSAVALGGALIGSFAPGAWVHGSALRSDGPALTLGVIGLAVAIRGLRSRRALLIASALFGASMGVRVTLLPVMGPTLALVFLARLRAREWRLVGAALAIAAAGILSWGVPIVWHTTWHVYGATVRQHARYAFSIDSIFAETANAVLSYRRQRFFVDVWGAPWIAWLMYTCSALGLLLLIVRREWRVMGWLAVAFLPIMAFTLVVNTPLAAPLYSLPYIPLFTGLAGFGIVTAPRLLDPGGRRPVPHVGLVLVGGVVAGLIVWTYPIIAMLRSEESPPVRAAEYLRKSLEPSRDVLYYERVFEPYVMFYLPRHRRHEGLGAEVNLIDPMPSTRNVYSLTGAPLLGDRGRGFHWSSRLGANRLRRLSLGRYFDAYATGPRLGLPAVFLSGFYPQEREDEESWRWMSGRGRAALYVGADEMSLRLRATVPDPAAGAAVVLRLDGVERGRLTPAGSAIDHAVTVRPDRDRLWTILTIETDRTFVPSRAGISTDNRELGLACHALSWSPARGSSPTITSPDQFLGPGWYPLESDGHNTWRWSRERAVAYLPRIDGDGRLEITMFVPTEGNGTRSTVTVEVARHVLDRFQPPIGPFHEDVPDPGVAPPERPRRNGALGRTRDGSGRPPAPRSRGRLHRMDAGRGAVRPSSRTR